ncbi:hypothetical protein DLM86_02190 [Paenibacillus flagellatus]|uniref:Uncharacterized protein n=1 Tax=Paenibacillus flagellatus TaxID=2211139 RepID=A0A2V5KFK8_9BACL|nr:hypothetical protein DLM86_02190 [Paenibacillus flagellatus]
MRRANGRSGSSPAWRAAPLRRSRRRSRAPPPSPSRRARAGRPLLFGRAIRRGRASARPG